MKTARAHLDSQNGDMRKLRGILLRWSRN